MQSKTRSSELVFSLSFDADKLRVDSELSQCHYAIMAFNVVTNLLPAKRLFHTSIQFFLFGVVFSGQIHCYDISDGRSNEHHFGSILNASFPQCFGVIQNPCKTTKN